MQVNEFTLPRPSNMHMHLRTGQMLKDLARPSTVHYHNILVMPNVDHRGDGRFIEDAPIVWQYYDSIKALIHPDINVWMTMYLTPELSPDEIQIAWTGLDGHLSVKFYPTSADGAGTTNAGRGLVNIRDGAGCFAMMEELGIILNVHAEVPGADYALAEELFIPELEWLISNFPRLRVVVEHVSSARMVAFVQEAPANVAASITTHHMWLTHHDLEDPHCCCLPRAKTPDDLMAVVDAATGNSPKFFFGDDTAPHSLANKLKQPPNNGIYHTSEVSLAAVVEAFEAFGGMFWQENLANFASFNACAFYDLPEPAPDDYITFRRDSWHVPEEVSGVVPFRAGKILQWSIEDPRY